MKINEDHIKCLKTIRAINLDGISRVLNKLYAEECVELELLEPGPNYKLTKKAEKFLGSN